jgi:hypothetical protein
VSSHHHQAAGSQEGDLCRVVHENTGNVLCSGSAADVQHWTEQSHKAKVARAAAEPTTADA